LPEVLFDAAPGGGDHYSMPDLAHDTRQMRTLTPSGAMHKHTARPTVRRAVTGDCYAANDAKGS